MTIRAAKFTPEVLLSAPRRSSGVPNSNGSRILYSVSTYSFADHLKRTEIRVLNVATQTSALITDANGASEPNWLGENHVLVLVPGEEGKTKFLAGNVDNFENRFVYSIFLSTHIISLETSQNELQKHISFCF